MIRLGALCAVLAAGVLFAAPAKADPVDDFAAVNAWRVCKVLDAYPYDYGVQGIADAIVSETQWTYYAAGRVIAESVDSTCPQHEALLRQFVYAHSPKQGWAV